MKEPILMPTLSDTMESGHLHQWLKQPGDPVKKGDALAEVESDKAVMELESFRAGYLAGPLAAAETDVAVGEVIGYITDSADAAPDAAPPSATEAGEHELPSADAVATAHASPGEPPKKPSRVPGSDVPPPATSKHEAELGGASRPSSPYARGLAQELGVELSAVRPGRDGVVRAAQVLAAALAGPQPRLEAGPAYRYKLLTPMHRAVAENMSATLATPTFRLSAIMDLQPLKVRARVEGHSLSLLLARDCAEAVARHRMFNAAWTANGLATREAVDVGVAMDVPGGLVTPVLRDAARRPLGELAEDWRALKQKARRGRLQPPDYEGATFYLSNLGTFPVVQRFEAIVPLGAAAILAVGAEHDGRTDVTLSCDHRVVFGADAARFLATLKSIIEVGPT